MPQKDFDNCVTGTNFNIAYPANESDPLYRVDKSSFNPVVNNTQRDPSMAWKTPYGEWRLTSFDTTSYASKDFVNWYSIGKQPGFSAENAHLSSNSLEPFASETQNVRFPDLHPCISFRFRMAAGTGCKSELGEMVHREIQANGLRLAISL